MGKIIFTTVLFLVFCGNIFPQNGKKLNDSDKQIFLQNLLEQSKKTKSLQCTMALEKTASDNGKTAMKGTMMYLSPSKLRWEYAAPTPATLIMNGNNAVVLDKNGEKTDDVKKLKQLGNFIMMMISGNGLMQQNKMFSSDLYELDNTQMFVVLTPVPKRMKDVFNKIELKIDRKTMLTDEIILDEKSGDKTVILLKNKALNIEIPQSKFLINKK